eukprot:gene23809-32198_t
MLAFILSTLILSSHLSTVKSLGRLRDAPVQNGLCDASVKSYSGYFEVSSGVDKNYFFWMFESRDTPATDPLILWLTGGPGCSSQLALLSENGPCKVTADGLSTENNPFSWNSKANIMWVDQPAQVGFSYGAKLVDNDHNEDEVAEDMYNFLQAFFVGHPEYLKSDFFVFGESYGGHYAPAVASRIYKGNQNKEGLTINLKGVGIGNGLTDPLIQYQYYPEMAMNNSYNIKTVSEEAYQSMVDHLPRCKSLAQACQVNTSACVLADDYCNEFETTPYYKSGLNPYDIRKECGSNSLCYDFSNIETFLNLKSTREALHVSPKVQQWKSCNNAVNAQFSSDWMKNYQQVIPAMIEDGVRVLIYAGDVDFICNWIGNKAWTQELTWTGKKAFNAEDDHEWSYTSADKSVWGGLARTARARTGGGSLTFLQVFEAGHMVPMDQPAAALEMLKAFTANQAFY